MSKLCICKLACVRPVGFTHFCIFMCGYESVECPSHRLYLMYKSSHILVLIKALLIEQASLHILLRYM